MGPRRRRGPRGCDLNLRHCPGAAGLWFVEHKCYPALRARMTGNPPTGRAGGGGDMGRASTKLHQVERDPLAEARDRFLAAEPVNPAQVREPILASWWRSRESNVA